MIRLFINKIDKDIIVAQIYVDDIIFRGFLDELLSNFIDIMQSEFEMSMVGEPSYFFWALDKARKRRNVYISGEICQEYCQEVWS